jgi:ketosteroid isomerase-like protein
VCRFDDEMIVEVRAYLDSAMVDYIIHRNENLAWQ